MASVVFEKKKSPTDSVLYSARYSPLGDGIPRVPQSNGAEQMEVYKGVPRDWPMGVDLKAPRLPGGK